MIIRDFFYNRGMVKNLSTASLVTVQTTINGSVLPTYDVSPEIGLTSQNKQYGAILVNPHIAPEALPTNQNVIHKVVLPSKENIQEIANRTIIKGAIGLNPPKPWPNPNDINPVPQVMPGDIDEYKINNPEGDIHL